VESKKDKDVFLNNLRAPKEYRQKDRSRRIERQKQNDRKTEVESVFKKKSNLDGETELGMEGTRGKSLSKENDFLFLLFSSFAQESKAKKKKKEVSALTRKLCKKEKREEKTF
jgi:hypothetical protein